MKKELITEHEVQGLQVSKIFKSTSTEVLLITLEKGKVFPKHTSPKDAFLTVIQGQINFHINNNTTILAAHEVFSFKKEIEHYVVAIEDSKFLIIR